MKFPDRYGTLSARHLAASPTIALASVPIRRLNLRMNTATEKLYPDNQPWCCHRREVERGVPNVCRNFS